MRLEILAAVGSAAFVASVVVACSSFGTSSSAADLDGGSTDGGGAETSAVDGAVSAGDGAPGKGPFCAAHPGAILCDDFDDPLRGVWNAPSVATGGSVAVVPDMKAPSAPNALRTIAPMTTSTACTYSIQDATLDVPVANAVHLEFKVRPEQLPGSAPIGPSIKLRGTSETCEYYLDVDPTGTVLVQEHTTAADVTKPLNRKLALDAWTKVSMDVTGAAPGKTITVSLDDVKVLTDVVVDPFCQDANRLVYTGVGLYCVTADTQGPVAMSFDDVLLTAN